MYHYDDYKTWSTSTLLTTVFYDSRSKNLYVGFDQNPSQLYQYKNVSKNAWQEFKAAPSGGTYYNNSIKNNYNTGEHITTGQLVYVIPDKLVYKFVVTGHSPVEYEVEAATIEAAIADFKTVFPKGTLEEVKISFE